MNDILKIVQALEDSNILLKGVTKIIKNETKDQKEGLLSMLLGTWASLLGNLLAEKWNGRVGSGNKKGKGTVRETNATSSFNKLWNTKVLSKRTRI